MLVTFCVGLIILLVGVVLLLSEIVQRLDLLIGKESLTREDLVDAIQSKPVSRWGFPSSGSFTTDEQYAEMFPWPPK